MTNQEELIRRLDAADPTPEAWEAEYARLSVTMTREQAYELVNSERAYADWLAFRFEAGPPGVALPPLEEALLAILTTPEEGSPADVYRVIFASGTLSDDMEPELIIGLLCNSAMIALKGGASWLSMWLAARAGIAALALGQAEEAWSLLDSFGAVSINGSRHVHMDKLALFESIRDKPSLQNNPWICGAIASIWPLLKVPLLPALPMAEINAKLDADDGAALSEVHAALDGEEMSGMRTFVESFVQSRSKQILDKYAEEPLVRTLRHHLMTSADLEVPDVGELPPWFERWSRALVRNGEYRMARLAGLVLVRTEDADPTLAGLLILRTARVADLPVLRAAFDEPVMHGLFDEVESAAARLPTAVADAVLAQVLPGHIERMATLHLIIQHQDAIEALEPVADGVIEHLISTLRTMERDRDREHQQARPEYERFTAAVRPIAGRLAEIPSPGMTDVENALAGLGDPPLSLPLLEMALDDHDLAPRVLLLQALVLERAVADTEHEAIWRDLFAKKASGLIFEHRWFLLFPLRLRLLDGLIARAHPQADLYHERANTRRVHAPWDVAAIERSLADWREAIRLADVEGDAGLRALAVAAQAKAVVRLAAVTDADLTERFQDAERAVADTLVLPLSDAERALLYQARAQLLRENSPEQVIHWLEQALAVAPKGDRLWVEQAAELVAALVNTGQVADAIAQGRSFLAQTNAVSDRTELGMLQLATGRALALQGANEEARQHLEAGLALVRGHDPHNESVARIQLAYLSIAEQDWRLAEEHLRVLRDRMPELDRVGRRDLHRAEVALAAARDDWDERRRGLEQLLDLASDAQERSCIRLELAQLELLKERAPEELDAIVCEAIEMGGDERVEGQLSQLICNHDPVLAEATWVSLLDWARQHAEPTLVARLLHRRGARQEACELLRRTLAGQLSDAQRIRCIHTLLFVLGGRDDGVRDERRELCCALESLLEGPLDAPHIRLDLVVAMRIDANGDADVLWRAWRHGLRGLAGVHDDWLIQFGNRQLAILCCELIRCSCGLASTAELAELASWLLQPRHMEQRRLVELRLEAARLLLIHGPLMHPRVLDVARGLVELVEPPPSQQPHEQTTHVQEALTTIRRRVVWIERRIGETDVPEIFPQDQQNPYDHVPDWLIALVAGHHCEVESSDLAVELDALGMAMHVRPDVADRVLAALVPLQAQLPPPQRDRFLDVVYASVQMNPDAISDPPWPHLRQALAAIESQHRHPTIVNIESAINRLGVHASPVPLDRDQRPTRTDSNPTERALACFEEGMALAHQARTDPMHAEANARIERARALHEQAVDIARENQMPQLFDFLVSWGNAWTTAPAEQLQKALDIYRQAEALEASQDQYARLWKVQADALHARGTADDLRRAEALLEQSRAIRTGWMRAETLVSSANVALVHPDLDELERLETAIERQMAAIRAARHHVEGLVPQVAVLLLELGRLRPTDPRPDRYREELKQFYPDRAADIERPMASLRHDDRARIHQAMEHPATDALVSIHSRLMAPDELATASTYSQHRGPTAQQRILAHMQTTSLLGRPDKLEEALASLFDDVAESARPGALVARAVLLAHLARLGHRSIAEVRAATDEAREAAHTVENAPARAMLLRALAMEWTPRDYPDGVVRDFALGIALLRECMDAEGGEEHASDDTLGSLARSYRYCPTGDKRANLLECRRLYRIHLDRARADGTTDVIAHCLHNLADVESQIGEGGRLQRLRSGAALIEEALSIVQSPFDKALYTSNLAWQLTQIATWDGRNPDIDLLRRTLAMFDQVDQDHLQPEFRGSHTNNRLVCESSLVHHTRGREGDIELWRAKISELESRPAGTADYAIAIAKHNLASTLMFGRSLAASQLAEGLRLSQEIAEIRTVANNARHHWETCINAGRAILGILDEPPEGVLPWTPEGARADSLRWLRRAIVAARALGPGEELADAGFALCRLAESFESITDFVQLAEEGWQAIIEAATFLLLHVEKREEEARVALRLGATLAYRYAETALSLPSPDVAFVLQGEQADAIRWWLLRSQMPLRRPLRARLARPAEVSLLLWTKWQNALRSGDQQAIADQLLQLQEQAPAFLSADDSMETTWTWLAQDRERVLVSAFPAGSLWLAFLARVDDDGRRRSWVMGLRVPNPPEVVNLVNHLPQVMSQALQEPGAVNAQEMLAAWARATIIEPICRFLQTAPSAVLWVPGPALRLLAPAAIWRDTPVALSTSISLPDLRAASGRRRATLVGLADPGANSSMAGFGEHGWQALQSLAATAATRGPIGLLASVGRQYGRTILGDHRGVRDTPASARDLIAEISTHDVIVLLAHGQVNAADDAALMCVDKDGHLEPLDIAMLTSEAEQLAGATFILLSCDGGRVGSTLADPGGIAGTLLSAGARQVIAPLWPVRIDIAAQVGNAVLRGLTAGMTPWQALAGLALQSHHDAPALGKPPPTPAARQANQRLQQLAFVTWVG